MAELNNYKTSLIMFNFINNNEENPEILYQKGLCNYNMHNYKQSFLKIILKYFYIHIHFVS